ncbi:MAG: type II toxin-antitoxin system RelE/ParE family toxin [Gammaproteobacteria bacterium]|nr:type II toxin-antitoxin system RelE/ParE family toxin [Gammaproteobacteria bacterium]
MRVFKTKTFAKWARKEAITDKVLLNAVLEIENGLVDAKLGGHVFKKRIPAPGRGKRGGARSILAYQTQNKAFFIVGYSKNEKINLDYHDLNIAKEFAKELLNASSSEITKLLKEGIIIEVRYET